MKKTEQNIKPLLPDKDANLVRLIRKHTRGLWAELVEEQALEARVTKHAFRLLAHLAEFLGGFLRNRLNSNSNSKNE